MEAKAGNRGLSGARQPPSALARVPDGEAGVSPASICFLRAWLPPCYGTPTRPRTGISPTTRFATCRWAYGNGGYHDRDCGIAMG